MYTQLLWCLSYFSVTNPFAASGSTVGQLSVPGILNILYCASLLLFGVESTNYLGSLKILVSQYMLFSVGNYVNSLVLLSTRLVAARSSATLFHTLTHLQTSVPPCKKELGKVSVLVIAILFGSTAYAVYACVKLVLQFQPMEIGGLVGRYLMLGVVVIIFTSLTDYTAVPFAVSYMVVIGQGLIQSYVRLCKSFRDSTLIHGNEHKTCMLKLQFRLLKKFVHVFEISAKWYSAGIIASGAVAWLQVIGIATTNNGQIGLVYIYYGFSNLFSFTLLMYVGNRATTEVS